MVEGEVWDGKEEECLRRFFPAPGLADVESTEVLV